jgi:hypothetical protein
VRPVCAALVISLAATCALAGGMSAASGAPAAGPTGRNGALGPAPTGIFAVTLEDPTGRRWALAELAGQAVVFVIADRAGMGQAKRWGEALAESRGDRIALWADRSAKLVVVSVADVQGVPGFARPMARWAIARMVAGEADESKRSGPPLLLDWDGEVAAILGAASGEATVRLLGADGRVEAEARGVPDAERLAALLAAIDRTLGPRPATAPGVQ